MNGEITASAHYDKGDIVVDTCSNLLRDIQLFPGPCPNDAWAGHIEITRGGKAASIKCDNCSGAQYLENIVVDDDSDSADLSPTQCFGRSCSITWSMKGMFELKIRVNILLIKFSFTDNDLFKFHVICRLGKLIRR